MKKTLETFSAILKMVCDEYLVSPDDVLGRSRKKEHREPRQVCHYLMKKHTKASLAEIGVFTLKDHATVLHSTKVVESEKEINKDFKNRVNDLDEICARKFRQRITKKELSYRMKLTAAIRKAQSIEQMKINLIKLM